MKRHAPLPLAIVLTLAISAVVAMADAPKPLPAPQGERPKFSSKIHIPVRPAAEKAALPAAGYELVFEDDFNGEKLDTRKWGFRLGDKMLSALQPENVSVKDGNLVIALRKESVRGRDYTAGGVISRRKFVYAYYEARFKTPPAEG